MFEKRWYPFAWLWYSAKFHLGAAFSGHPVVVYQMGKVGSQAIVRALLRADLKRPVFHVHSLTHDGLKRLEKLSAARSARHPGEHYWAGKYLARTLQRSQSSKSWSVISLVRDPIARNISAFFQGIDYWYPDYRDELRTGGAVELVGRLIDVFMTGYPHAMPLEWFDRELRTTLGIDIFTHSFSPDAGYSIIESQDRRLLLIRLESLNDVAATALGAFLDVNVARPSAVNEAQTKPYWDLYQGFKQQVHFSSDFLERVYSSNYVTHFYSDSEVKELKKRWSSGQARSSIETIVEGG